MRRLLAVIAGLLLLLGLLGPNAVAGEDRTTDPDDHRPTLTLYATETSSVAISPTGEVDPAEDDPSGFAPGARFLAVDTLYSDEARTKRVGRNDLSCDVTEITGPAEEPTGASLLCSGVIALDDQGSLAWQASVSFAMTEAEDSEAPFATVAITGGTGDFRKAGGQVAIFEEGTPGEDEDSESLTRYEVELLQLKARR